MEVDAVSRTGIGKEKSGKGKKGDKKRKEKKATPEKVTEERQQDTHDSMENAETVESMDTKQFDCR